MKAESITIPVIIILFGGDDTFEMISERIADEPTLSTRQLAAETGVHQSSIVRCLQKNNFHPYKITKIDYVMCSKEKCFHTLEDGQT